MKMNKIGISLLFFVLSITLASGQDRSSFLVGTVKDSQSGDVIPFVNLALVGTKQGVSSDSLGRFMIGPVKQGVYMVQASAIGYASFKSNPLLILSNDTLSLNFELAPNTNEIEEVTITAAPFKQPIDMPISLRTLRTDEIQRNPGSDNDISRVIQTLPGVTTTSAFRNDLIIRGGAPNENRFFLDDIEIPVINHLVTQGASGGAFSIINANQLTEVDYLSSSFPANRGNALSSVFNFSLKDGRRDRLGYTATIGGTEIGLAAEGPINEKVSFLFSIRRSYRQYILRLLDFAFLPVYNDATAKLNIQLDEKNEITLLGIGAIDNFQLNEDVGSNEIQRYLLDNLPISQQSNYTFGAVFKHYTDNGYFTLVGSRSGFRNGAEKYLRNDDSIEDNALLKYDSREYSNRFRAEYTFLNDEWKINIGAGVEDIYGEYDVFNRIFNQYGAVTANYLSELNFQQYSTFGQVSRNLLDGKLGITLGFRTDASNYNDQMNNPLDQLSGRLALSYALSPRTTVTAGVANYYQLPPMMTLSYRNSGELDNQDVAEYLKSWHYVAGLKWDTPFKSQLSVEGFYKHYPNYLLSLRDSISIAHLPADFGVFGSFPVDFSSEGRAYGLEVFYQQRMFQGFYGMLSYTLSKSEYVDKTGEYIPSSWDARHILNFILGKKFNEKWEVGVNWRMQSALPFTPFDTELSAQRAVWDIANQGIRDYSQLNANRNPWTNTIDLRVDRFYRFPKWRLNLYLDIENLTASADSQQALILDRQLGSDGNFTDDGLIVNPQAPYTRQRYRVKEIANAQGALIPTFGMILEW
ncbi:MAG: TonB-dependent receptor [Bacteroidota bacterium]